MGSARSAHIVRIIIAGAIIGVVSLSNSSSAWADHAQFTSSFLDNANSWPGDPNDAGIYGQGFTPSLDTIPDPNHSALDLVGLDRFTFFKDGHTDSASNIKLAIFDNFFLDLTGLTTSRSEFVGISTNTVTTTAGLSVGEAYTFEFASLQLEFGSDYGAIFVNDDGFGNLTPIKVSALTADYQESSPGSGLFFPVSNYGGSFDFQYATSNFINSNQFGDFLFGFSEGGDARFEAVFDLESLAGDFNGDGTVDGIDFLEWQRNPNVGLLSEWESNYGTSVADSVAVVPEPSGCVLFGSLTLAFIGLRRRIYS